MSLYPSDGAEVDPGADSHLDAQMQSMLAMGDAASMMNDFGPDLVPMDFEPTSLAEPPDVDAYIAQGHANPSQQHQQGQAQSQNQDGSTTGSGQEQSRERAMSGVGAGPLPTGYGVALPANAGSTLTEFTKRRNWSQRVIEELKDFMHILTPDGRLIYVSPSTKSLTGHDDSQLLGKFIFNFIHPDDSSMFMREFNESIATGNPLRFFYRFRKPDDTYTIFEVQGHPHLASEAAAFGPNSSATFCRGFFMMARLYPTKNATLLDSFLEHKIENERLQKRIADLKREEQEDLENQRHQLAGGVDGTQSEPIGDRGNNDHTSQAMGTPNTFSNMGPPAKPGQDNSNALTRRNLDEALAASRPDSINDKMARYEGATHIETIEMLTGLRYRDGERSKGISTGASSPTLIRGDAGIAIPVDKDSHRTPGSRAYAGGSPYGDMASNTDKKKKIKVADEYVCTDCGTLDSPEWRKGPNGPKTLCNACGLRWAKKEKKRTGSGNGSGNGTGIGLGGIGVDESPMMQGQASMQTTPGSGLQQLTPSPQTGIMAVTAGVGPGLLPADPSMPP